MARFLHRNFAPLPRKYADSFLAFFWCIGLFCGIFIFFTAGDPTVSLMRLAVHSPASIVNLLLCELLPFLLSALAVFWGAYRLLYGCAFFRAVLFSFFSLGVFTAFGSAGWLLYLLLMFSDIVLCVLLYLFWLRCIDRKEGFRGAQAVAYLAGVLLTGSVNMTLIEPLIGRIF